MLLEFRWSTVAWDIATARRRNAKCAGEVEGALKDLQFLAAAGEADTGHQNGEWALIRSYLCLLKAEQQVKSTVMRRFSTYQIPPCIETHAIILHM